MNTWKLKANYRIINNDIITLPAFYFYWNFGIKQVKSMKEQVSTKSTKLCQKWKYYWIKISRNLFQQSCFKYCIFSCSSTPQISLERWSKLSNFSPFDLQAQDKDPPKFSFEAALSSFHKYLLEVKSHLGHFWFTDKSFGSHFAEPVREIVSQLSPGDSVPVFTGRRWEKFIVYISHHQSPGLDLFDNFENFSYSNGCAFVS